MQAVFRARAYLSLLVLALAQEWALAAGTWSPTPSSQALLHGLLALVGLSLLAPSQAVGEAKSSGRLGALLPRSGAWVSGFLAFFPALLALLYLDLPADRLNLGSAGAYGLRSGVLSRLDGGQPAVLCLAGVGFSLWLFGLRVLLLPQAAWERRGLWVYYLAWCLGLAALLSYGTGSALPFGS